MSFLTSKDVRSVPAWRELLDATAPAAGRARPADEIVMNDTERAYGKHLTTLVMAGELRWWSFGWVRLRIAVGRHPAYFKPDFFVVYADGAVAFHETKGYEREAAMVRLKVAAGMYPVPFVLVKRAGRGWDYELFGSGNGNQNTLPPATPVGRGVIPGVAAKPARPGHSRQGKTRTGKEPARRRIAR